MTDMPRSPGVAKRRPTQIRREADSQGQVLTLNTQPTGVEILPISSLTLLLTTGRAADAADVLIPLVDFRLVREVQTEAKEGEEAEMEEAFGANVAFDNFAFLLMDMARDLKKVSKQIAQVTQGELSVEPGRMSFARDCLRKAGVFLTECSEELDRVPMKTEQAGPAPTKRVRVTAQPKKAHS